MIPQKELIFFDQLGFKKINTDLFIDYTDVGFLAKTLLNALSRELFLFWMAICVISKFNKPVVRIFMSESLNNFL